MEVKAEVRAYILENFVPGSESALTDDTPLITGGLVDSVGMIGLVRFIETRYDIELTPHDLDHHSLDSVESIERLIQRKTAQGPPR